jgi:hypothetical protein
MLTLEEFRKKYQKELKDHTEDEVQYFYDWYVEDPLQFHPSMIF